MTTLGSRAPLYPKWHKHLHLHSNLSMERIHVLLSHLRYETVSSDHLGKLSCAETSKTDISVKDTPNLQVLLILSPALRLPVISTSAPSRQISLAEWRKAVGTEFGVSEYIEITQDRVDAFALVTGDHQWIHTRDAKQRGSPFGGAIAHGLLLLSLVPFMAASIVPIVEEVSMNLNYGFDKLRFVAPTKVGTRIRLRLILQSISSLTPSAASGGRSALHNTMRCIIELEHVAKPALVFEWQTRSFL